MKKEKTYTYEICLKCGYPKRDTFEKWATVSEYMNDEVCHCDDDEEFHIIT